MDLTELTLKIRNWYLNLSWWKRALLRLFVLVLPQKALTYMEKNFISSQETDFTAKELSDIASKIPDILKRLREVIKQ
jgi:hypothetical protein